MKPPLCCASPGSPLRSMAMVLADRSPLCVEYSLAETQKALADALTRQLMARIGCAEASVRPCRKQTVTLKSEQLEF